MLPSNSKRAQSLLSETYAAAEGYAFQIECENQTYISKKGDSINNIEEKVKEDGLQNDKNISNDELHEKLNSLSKQLENINSAVQMVTCRLKQVTSFVVILIRIIQKILV